MDLYFERHDGQAVTTDDFVAAMQDASGIDLAQFKRWYEQAGTPVLDIAGDYDAAAQRYTLKVRQSCPPTPGQEEKLPFHIPFAVGLVAADGRDLAARMLSVKAAEETFVFEGHRRKAGALDPARIFGAGDREVSVHARPNSRT